MDKYTVGALSKSLSLPRVPPKNSALSKLFTVPNEALVSHKIKPTKIKTKASKSESKTNATVTKLSPVPRKRKSFPVEDDEGDVGTVKKTKFKRNSEEEDRTIFVGNVPNQLVRKELATLFKIFGKIESVRIRSVAVSEPKASKKLAAIRKEFHPDRHNMNAYIRFSTKEQAISALAMNGQTVKGFHLRVDMANHGKQHHHKRSIFVGNLAFSAEEDEVRSHFEDCGEIESVRLIRHPYTGMGKGFGYVLFKSPHSVELALRLTDTEFKGRQVRVSRSVPKEKADKIINVNRRIQLKLRKQKRAEEIKKMKATKFNTKLNKSKVKAKNNNLKK